MADRGTELLPVRNAARYMRALCFSGYKITLKMLLGTVLLLLKTNAPATANPRKGTSSQGVAAVAATR